MTEKIYNDVAQVIEKMAKSLGVAAEHVYEILIRQQLVIGVSGTLAALLVITGLIVALTIYFRSDKLQRRIRYSDLDIFVGVATVIWGFLSVGLFIMLFVDFVPRLINPEYYAIKEILDTLKGASE